MFRFQWKGPSSDDDHDSANVSPQEQQRRSTQAWPLFVVSFRCRWVMRRHRATTAVVLARPATADLRSLSPDRSELHAPRGQDHGDTEFFLKGDEEDVGDAVFGERTRVAWEDHLFYLPV